MDDKNKNPSEVAQNPFAALFPSVEKAEEYRKQHGEVIAVHSPKENTVSKIQPISVLLRDVQEIESKNEAGHTTTADIVIDEKERAWILNDLLQRVFLITVDNGNNYDNNINLYYMAPIVRALWLALFSCNDRAFLAKCPRYIMICVCV